MPGRLENGVWQRDDPPNTTPSGEFRRPDSQFRDWITADGTSPFRAEPGRYHLYVSFACPWAHRTLIVRKIKGLEDVLPISVVDPVSGADGWVFSNYPGATADHANGLAALWELYVLGQPNYTGRVTVPVLWDTKSKRIVNNESSEIIRMLNSAFKAYEGVPKDFLPSPLLPEIERINAFVYERVNNGVYRCGFAASQAAYDSAAARLFSALDVLEDRLSRQRYLVGDVLTEADVRLFPTLVRFDNVYAIHFKCTVKRIADYPNLSSYVRDIYQTPGVADTVNMDHIKRHYYLSHPALNPSRLVPLGPVTDFLAPHNRGLLH